MEFRSPRARTLWDKWRHVWMLAWERQRRLHDHLMHLHDVERVRQFSWDEWRKRVSLNVFKYFILISFKSAFTNFYCIQLSFQFLKFMNHKKSRLTDLFRKMDKDNNGLIPRDIFIDGIINTSTY